MMTALLGGDVPQVIVISDHDPPYQLGLLITIVSIFLWASELLLTRYAERQAINYCDDSSSSNTNNGFTPIPSGAKTTFNKRLAAHGILASLAFVIFFPAGAIAIRLASFPFVVAFHGAFQVFAYLVYIAAFGLGVTMANDLQVVRLPNVSYCTFLKLT